MTMGLGDHIQQLTAEFWRLESFVFFKHLYHFFIPFRMLQTAHQAHEDEININVLGRTYTIDFASMTQINEETGNTRPVQRKCTGHQPTHSMENIIKQQIII